ncbi:MAG: DNA polymerase IV [Cyclobacteriaceae bacterium]
MASHRKIIHIDMDAFFASVEQMDDPNLRGKPVAVGGNKERGVVAAASYEARKFGVRSAMSAKLAAMKCPRLIFVPPRFDRYKEISNAIRKIFLEYTPLVEPLSLDEAFLDVTENHFNLPSATLIAKEIRERIRQEIGLNASAGISYNKFLAKVASDLNKPNGQAVIPPEKANVFLEKLPIEKFYGVGKVMAQKMKNLGIHNGWDLKQYSLSFLVKRFGKSGLHYYDIVRGVHQSEVKPNRIRKSLGVEKTFEKDIFEMADIENALMDLLKVLFFRLEKAKTQGRTVTLKIKYNDFSLLSRSKSHPDILALAEIQQIVLTLMEQEQITKPIRLLGISISNLGGESIELTFGEQLSFDY